MPISHAKSNPVADFTGTVTVFNSQGSTATVAATDLVRPADWNSAHNLTYKLEGNTSSNSTAGGSDVYFNGAGGLTLLGNGSTLTFSAAAPATLSSWAREFTAGHTTGFITVAANANTSGPVSMFPFTIPYYISAGFLDLAASMGFTTGTSNNTARHTGGISVALYSRYTNSDSSRLATFAGTKFEWSISYNSNSYTTTFPTSYDYSGYGNGNGNSGGVNWTSGYTGLKKFAFPVNTLLTPGVYWLGVLCTSTTINQNSGKCGLSLVMDRPLNISYVTQLAPPGSASADGVGASVSDQRWRHPALVGWGSYSEANLTSCPATLALSKVQTGMDSHIPMAIWRT